MDEDFKHDRRQDTEKERLQRLEREQLARSYKKVFSGPDGRLVLLDLVEKCHVFAMTFHANNGKIQDFAEGQRNIGNYILCQLEMQDTEKLRGLKEGGLNA